MTELDDKLRARMLQLAERVEAQMPKPGGAGW
jgi:hypothetical protein